MSLKPQVGTGATKPPSNRKTDEEILKQLKNEGDDDYKNQPESFKKKKDYKFIKLLGGGVSGKVIQATWYRPGRKPKPVALKIIKKNDRNALDVRKEIDLMSNFNHENIVQFYEWFESNNYYYMSFELACGENLMVRFKDRQAKKKRFTEAEVVKLLRSLLSATEYLHQDKIVHRDLKPENIVYRTREETSDIVLVDFGIADRIEGRGFNKTVGSPKNIAPEILRAARFPGLRYKEKVDMWSIGVISYFLLSGQYPFKGANMLETFTQIKEAELEFKPHELWKGISPEAKDFIGNLIQWDSSKRMSATDALKHESSYLRVDLKWITKTELPTRIKTVKEKLQKVAGLIRTYLSTSISVNCILGTLILV
ncbi:kinase-like domain-containing protein [Phellopilus nigrolimitatus]|nr:kinase-like domain-containing protein [Phellopilus nigrolimitatus]